MQFSFDEPVSRLKTRSLKWDKYRNKDIIPMWVADMDFPAAPAIQEALFKRAAHGIYGYTIEPPMLRELIVEMYKNDFNWQIKEEWIVMLPSVVSALNTCAWTFAGPQKSVLTVKPVYHPFFLAPVHAGSSMNLSTLKKTDDRFELDFDELEKVITPDTSLWIFCNPHNPAGKVFSKNELEKTAEFCIKHDLILCSDEIHSGLVLDENKKHIPIASLSPEIAKRTITLNSPSKTFNIPGLNFGFAIIPDEELRRKFARTNDGFSPYVNLFAYEAAVAAYKDSRQWYEALIAYLRKNYTAVHSFIAKNPLLEILPSDATYLAWINIKKLNLEQPTAYFEKFGVGFNDGRIFGGEGYLRLNFGCPRTILDEGLKRFQNGIDSLSL